jgi:hypothetical protein
MNLGGDQKISDPSLAELHLCPAIGLGSVQFTDSVITTHLYNGFDFFERHFSTGVSGSIVHPEAGRAKNKSFFYFILKIHLDFFNTFISH